MHVRGREILVGVRDMEERCEEGLAPSYREKT